MAIPEKKENPVGVAEKLLANPDEVNPGTIAALIGELGHLQEEGLARLESEMDRGKPLRLDQALEHFAATGPILRYGRLIGELRQLYMVKA